METDIVCLEDLTPRTLELLTRRIERSYCSGLLFHGVSVDVLMGWGKVVRLADVYRRFDGGVKTFPFVHWTMVPDS